MDMVHYLVICFLTQVYSVFPHVNKYRAASFFNGFIVFHYIDVLQLEIFMSSEPGCPWEGNCMYILGKVCLGGDWQGLEGTTAE